MKTSDLKFFENFLQERKKIILENIQSNSKEIEALHNSAPSDSVDFSTIEINSQIDFAISANLKKFSIKIMVFVNLAMSLSI